MVSSGLWSRFIGNERTGTAEGEPMFKYVATSAKAARRALGKSGNADCQHQAATARRTGTGNVCHWYRGFDAVPQYRNAWFTATRLHSRRNASGFSAEAGHVSPNQAQFVEMKRGFVNVGLEAQAEMPFYSRVRHHSVRKRW